MFDEEKPGKQPVYAVGQDISEASVSELDRMIEQLEQEIMRLKDERSRKAGVIDAASALFRK